MFQKYKDCPLIPTCAYALLPSLMLWELGSSTAKYPLYLHSHPCPYFLPTSMYWCKYMFQLCSYLYQYLSSTTLIHGTPHYVLHNPSNEHTINIKYNPATPTTHPLFPSRCLILSSSIHTSSPILPTYSPLSPPTTHNDYSSTHSTPSTSLRTHYTLSQMALSLEATSLMMPPYLPYYYACEPLEPPQSSSLLPWNRAWKTSSSLIPSGE